LLAGNANSLSHLSVGRSLGWATVVRNALLLRVLVHLSALAFIISLALSLLLLLLCLPFLADLLELFRCSLRTVRLHCDVRVQVVQSTVGLFASVPAALVHALNLLIAAARSLVLLRTWNGYK
jgi:hypothetical protein